MNRAAVLSVLAAATLVCACTPTAPGVCESDSACKPDESCHQGLCIKRSLLSDGGGSDAGPDGGGDGGPDAGSDGGSDGGVDAGCLGAGCQLGLVIQRPSADEQVRGTFRVEAQASSASTPDEVTFTLTSPVGSTELASAKVTQAGPGQLYAADLTVGPAISGAANLNATVRVGSTTFNATAVRVIVDQAAPAISTAWDGTQWRGRTGSFEVQATVADDRDVASARLDVSLADGGTASFTGALAGTTATFTIPAAQLAVDGASASLPFSLFVADRAGNTASVAATAATVLRVDDQKPSVSAPGDGVWHGSSAVVAVAASDQGSGIDPAKYALQVSGATASLASSSASGATFTVDLTGVAAGFEGTLSYQASAADRAGNEADAGGTILVDRAPPAFTSLAVLTAPDNGKWFRATGTSSIVVQAAIDAGAGSPLDIGSIALDAGVEVPRDPDRPAHTFLLPRGVGANLEGSLTIEARARDLAGNAGFATTTVWFDDKPPALDGGMALPDGGAWVRKTLADGGPAAAQLAVAVSDDGVGMGPVELRLPDAGTLLGTMASSGAATYAGALDVSTAAAGVAGPFVFSVRARDGFDNASVRNYAVLVDDAKPQISQTGNDVDGAWHSGLAGSTTSQVTPVVTIADEGSGVAGAPSLALADGGVVSTAHLLGGGTSSNGRWQFDAFTVPADPSMNGAVAFTVTASDGVGNAGSAAVVQIRIDNQPPVFASVNVPADGAGWLRGPNVTSGGDSTTVDLAASITEPRLLSASATFAGAGSPVTGILGGDQKWHFAIPRAIGAGGGTRTVTLTAVDQAQNVATATADLKFEDGRPTLSVASDTAWYGRGGDLSVVATLSALPASGVGSATLDAGAGAGCAAIAGTPSNGGLTLTFALPRSCAPAGVEAAFDFAVSVTSGAGVVTGANGSRNIDDKGPTLTAFSAPAYLSASTGQLAYGRDGSHFTVRDGNVTLGAFTAYDCGAGLANDPSTPPGVTIGGTPSTRAVAVTNTDTKDCGGGRSVPIRTFTVTADFASASGWTYGLDAAPSVSVAVADVLGTPSVASTSVNVTRRWFSTGNVGATRMAVGPHLFVRATGGLSAISRSNGATLWTDARTVLAGPVVLPNGGAPRVDYAVTDPGAGSGYLGVDAAATTRNVVASCTLTDGAPDHLVVHASGNASSGAQIWVDSFEANCGTDENPIPCTQYVYHADPVSLGGSTCVASPFSGVRQGSAIGRAYEFHRLQTDATKYSLAATSLSTREVFTRLTAPTSVIAVDNGAGSDVAFSSGGSKYVVDATGITATSVGISNVGSALASPQRVLGRHSTAGEWRWVDFAGGTHGAGVPTAVPNVAPLIDGARPTAVAWLTGVGGAAAISARYLDVDAGFTGTGPSFDVTFPANVDDVILAADGTLYVAAGGTVYAYATASPGLGTYSIGNAALGWPAFGRDACRSFNLGMSCPY